MTERYSLIFWGLFGKINQEYFSIEEEGFEPLNDVSKGIFGVFNVVAVLVALNMLIAILNESYTRISVSYFCQVTYHGGQPP